MVSGCLKVVKVISRSAPFTTSRLLRIWIRTSFSQLQREQSFYDKNEHKLPANRALCFGLTCFVYTSRSHIQLTKVGNNFSERNNGEGSNNRLPNQISAVLLSRCRISASYYTLCTSVSSGINWG